MSPEIYKPYIRPALDRIGHSEQVHTLAREALHHAEISPFTLWLLEKTVAYESERFSDERLAIKIGDTQLESPLIVGAGWDKDGRAVNALWQLGFAAVEVGSITLHPQSGKPKPRQWMITSDVCIQSLGFPSEGADEVVQNLERYRNSSIPIGINIGLNSWVKHEDAAQMYSYVIIKCHEHATYFAYNISSPNTPRLRELQDKTRLTDIIQAGVGTMKELGQMIPLYIYKNIS